MLGLQEYYCPFSFNFRGYIGLIFIGRLVISDFSILLVLQAIGFEWVRLPFIGYYMVGILIEADIPFDAYFVSAGISLSRLLSFVVFTFFVANRVKRGPLFISTAVAVITGNL